MASQKKNKISKSRNQQLKTGVGKMPLSPKPRIEKPLIMGHWEINALIFLLLIIATLILYAGDLHLGFFAVDDQQYVVDNPWIRGRMSQNMIKDKMYSDRNEILFFSILYYKGWKA